MAFEAFLGRDDGRPRWRGRFTFAVSLIVHGGLLAAGIAYSFWRVDDISPPTVRITFMSSTPPAPPAPPPPAAAGSQALMKKPSTKIKPSLTDLLQPRPIPARKEEARTEPPDDDDPDQAIAGGTQGGVKGGAVIGGTVGGAIGGTMGGTVGGIVNGGPPTRPTAPKMLPPQMGKLQKASGEDPDFPAVLRRGSGMSYIVMAKICVSRAGAVDSVAIMKSADAMLDGNVVKAVKGWRYRPLLADNNAVPFCYFGRFEFTN